MLEVFTNSTAGVATAVNTPIQFTTGKVQTGCTSTASVPTTTVNLNKPGFYIVQFDAVVANNTGAAANVGVQMLRNGAVEDSARTLATSTGATDLVAISFATIVQVTPNFFNLNNNATLSFNITGADALVFQANVVVNKIA